MLSSLWITRNTTHVSVSETGLSGEGSSGDMAVRKPTFRDFIWVKGSDRGLFMTQR